MPQRDSHDERTDQGAHEPFSAAALARGFGARRRMLLLIATVLLMVFLAAPTTKIYLDQRAEIRSLEQSISENQTARDDLQHEVSLWDDPAYVRQQARNRLLMVEPGERSYLVVGADSLGDEAPESSAVQEEADRPAWADALWGSVLDSGWPEQRTSPSQAENFPQLGDAAQPTETSEPGADATTDPAAP
ncbi:septum formation initiator family protein [Kocuria coralli]|uniref:Septum formation initiator family protein n=1 Tax=Kocuria coralli TaxID=1461025 RepID=A0A5J5KYA5_9MICC|nr:septum formation initiator family protein [Kocuria coralli]KAA9394653.1 septum formation initiator family protein [Kocuria coralli]